MLNPALFRHGNCVLISNLNLVLPDKPDAERDLVAKAWAGRGGTVTRIGRFWDPPALDREAVRLYANETFALVLAQKLNLVLVSPDDDLLVRLPASIVGRTISIYSLQEVLMSPFPAFVKPLVPKQFRAAVYKTATSLQAECRGLANDALVYISEVVRFTSEARGFILEGTVQDVAIYEGTTSLSTARAFLETAARHSALPSTCVLDVGEIEGRGWAVIEANAAWGAGLNGCSADKVLGCIASATCAAE